MIKRFILVLLISAPLMANIIQLATTVEDTQLIPVIKINGKTVITLKDSGGTQYSSPFERSEKIYQTFLDVQKQSKNLNRIRIRLSDNKTDYVGYVDNIELYHVTPSDVIGTDRSVYQTAVEWRDNIYEALTIHSGSVVAEDPVDESVKIMPFIGLYSLFSSGSLIITMLQLVIFLAVQVGGMMLFFRWINDRQDQVFKTLTKKLNQSQHDYRRLNNLLIDLQQDVEVIRTNHDQNRQNISNMR